MITPGARKRYADLSRQILQKNFLTRVSRTSFLAGATAVDIPAPLRSVSRVRPGSHAPAGPVTVQRCCVLGRSAAAEDRLGLLCGVVQRLLGGLVAVDRLAE